MELIAQAVDLLTIQVVNFLRANTKRGTRIPDPTPVPRPGAPGQPSRSDASTPAPARRMATKDELAAFFGGRVRYTPTDGNGNAEA